MFDVSQTEGKDLPALTEVQGDVSGYRERLVKFVESQNIKPVALTAGLPNIGWHSFRHTVSAWSKEAGLELEEVKTLLRHENIVTTSDVYGDLGMDAKRRIQKRLVAFVTQQARDQGAKHETDWRQDAPATIQ